MRFVAWRILPILTTGFPHIQSCEIGPLLVTSASTSGQTEQTAHTEILLHAKGAGLNLAARLAPVDGRAALARDRRGSLNSLSSHCLGKEAQCFIEQFLLGRVACM